MRGLGLPPSCVSRAWRRFFSCKDSQEVLPTFPSSAPSHFPLLPVASLSAAFCPLPAFFTLTCSGKAFQGHRTESGLFSQAATVPCLQECHCPSWKPTGNEPKPLPAGASPHWGCPPLPCCPSCLSPCPGTPCMGWALTPPRYFANPLLGSPVGPSSLCWRSCLLAFLFAFFIFGFCFSSPFSSLAPAPSVVGYFFFFFLLLFFFLPRKT